MGDTRDRVEWKVRTQGNTLGGEPSAECRGDMGDLISMVFMRRRVVTSCWLALRTCPVAKPAPRLWQGDLIYDDEQLLALKVQ